jgi:hypothetical protein
MSPLWIVPTVVIGVGAIALTALLRGAGEEARALTQEVARFGELHVALSKVRAEVARTRMTARSTRR